MAWLNALMMQTPSAITARNPLVSGTWYTPSATRPTLVIIQLEGDAITGGDVLDFDIDLRDGADAAVSGFPINPHYDRGGGALGNNNLGGPFGILVSAGYDYSVTDNSTGVTGIVMRAIEVTL